MTPKKHLIYIGLLILIAVLWISDAFAQSEADNHERKILRIEEGQSEHQLHFDLNPFIYILPDSTGNLTYEQISSPEFQSRFVYGQNEQLDLYHKDIPWFWIRLTIASDFPRPLGLMVAWNLPEVNLYQRKDSGEISIVSSGVLTSIFDRPYSNQYGSSPYLPLEVRPDETQTYYFRVKPMRFFKHSRLNGVDRTLVAPAFATFIATRVKFLDALSLGIILAVALYQLAIFLYGSEALYLRLSLLSFSFFLVWLHFRDYGFEIFWPAFPAFNYIHLEYITSLLQFWTLIEFGRRYMNMAALVPAWDRIAKWSLWIYIGYRTLEYIFLLADRENYFTYLLPLAGIEFLLILSMLLPGLAAQIAGMRKKYRPSISYFIATLAPMVMTSVQIVINLSSTNLAGQIDFLLIGIAIMQLLLAVGLAERFKTLQDETVKAQKEKLEIEESQRKNQEEINEQLVKADKLKDQFLANTSHELRTPLNGIIGLAESLYDGVAGVPTPTMKSNLAMIMASGKRLANLVNDILDFSKLKNQDLDLRINAVDLNSLVEVVMQINQPSLQLKPVKIINDIPRNLPAVSIDENRIEQVLHNLIGNAIKFTEQGTITIRAWKSGNMVEVSIADTGIGFPKDKADHIFLEFEQADGSISRAYGGTGLGLSISRQIVELHGGKIWAESVFGEGATFYFTLPVSLEKPMPGAQINRMSSLSEVALIKDEEPSIVPLTNVYIDEETIQILIVDDEPINHQVLRNHLSTRNFHVVSAMNGEEVMEILKTDQVFDLVLLDLMMPKMSGYEVCKRIREKFLPSELPVIMVTAKNQVPDLVHALSMGANDYLAKPFSKDEFLARVNNQLNLNNIYHVAHRFIPSEFLYSLGYDSIMDVHLGDQIAREMSVLFLDIRDYTSLSEQMTPEETFRFVNAYTQRMGPVIQRNQGFVNQYYGDGIMALFPYGSDHALRAMMEMQALLDEYNQVRATKGRVPIRVGMGLHTGTLIMGIIGDKNRTEATTIADSVNTSSRIEGLTKYFQTKILFSEASLKGLVNPEEFEYRFLGKIQVKGKASAIGIYECFGADSPAIREKKRQTIALFQEALADYLNKDFINSMKKFQAVLAQNPEDGPARVYLERLESYLAVGVSDDWSGHVTMTEK
ncbi:MAG: response regulator [Bacteroidia bacterium]